MAPDIYLYSTFIDFFVISLKIIAIDFFSRFFCDFTACGLTEKTSRPSCYRYPFTTASWFIVKFSSLLISIGNLCLQNKFITLSYLTKATYCCKERKVKRSIGRILPRSVAFVSRPFLFRQGSERNNFDRLCKICIPYKKERK